MIRPSATVPLKKEAETTGYRQIRIDSLTNPVLLEYLKERGISSELARKTCKEVHFQNNGKWYFAVAFANRSGGYEIRNKYLKGSISPKEITHIKNGSSRCLIFEGFMDYLSYLMLKVTHENSLTAGSTTDYIVLNSVSNVNKAIPLLREYENVFSLLDNDHAGRQTFRQIAEAGCPVKDKSACYREYNDLNDYLMDKKMVKEDQPHHTESMIQKEKHKTTRHG